MLSMPGEFATELFIYYVHIIILIYFSFSSLKLLKLVFNSLKILLLYKSNETIFM
jgi:hypothetical protein